MDTSSYWKILLTRQRERGKKGFTLPYLIGSQAFLPATHKKQNIGDILTDMVLNQSFETSIRYCTDTYALIFEIRNNLNMVAFPTFKSGQQNRLSISLLNNDIGDSVEDVIESLIEKYQDKIDSGNYSARPSRESRESNWNDFSSEEKDFISECFKNL